MATRTIWQDVYTVQFDKDTGGSTLAAHITATDAANPTYAVTEIGIQGTGSANGKFSMPLNDHPNYKAPSGNLETEQATGIATRRRSEYNIVQTGEAVQFNLPQNGDGYNTSLFAQLLFQYGFTEITASEMTGMNVFKCAQYAEADTKYFAQFVRHLQADAAGASIDLLVQGGICHTLAVSAETGGLLTIEPTVYGAKWSQANMSGVANEAADSFANITPLKFQDSTFAILDVDHDNAVTLASSTFGVGGVGVGTITGNGSAEFATNFLANSMVLVEGSALNDGLYGVDAPTVSDTILTVDLADDALVAEAAVAGVKFTPAQFVDVATPSVNMTFTNNCQFNYYNDDAADNAVVGRLTVEGSFSMPFGQTTVGTNYMVNRFLNGEEFLLAWYWGRTFGATDIRNEYKLNPVSATLNSYKNDAADTSPKNFASFVVCARITDYEVSGDNEQMVDVTFQGVTTDWHNAMEAYFAVDTTKLERVV